MVILWMIIEYGPLSTAAPKFEIMGLCQPVTSNIQAPIYIRGYGQCHPYYIEYSDNFVIYR